MISQRCLSISVAVAVMLLTVSLAQADGFLSVRGGKVVDSSGKPFYLKGFNVEFKDFRRILGIEDIKRIADAGANSIRLVLTYRDFESAPFVYDRRSFELMDRILAWCGQYRIFVILDMHLAPGIQNTHDFVVHREKTARFWRKRHHRERFYALWSHIARRYAKSETVAGYDLLNEGMPPDMAQYRIVMNRTARTIRKHDGNHMLIVEEAILPERRTELALIEDSNVLYSIHFFYPSQFSFYVTTEERVLTAYPGEMVTAGAIIGQARSTGVGDRRWQQLELRARPPEGAEILLAHIFSSDNKGTVFVDDIRLTIDDKPIDLPAPLVDNGSFEIEYPGFNWNASGLCASVSDTIAHKGKRSLILSGCGSVSEIRSSPIRTGQGDHILSAWYGSEKTGGIVGLSITWHRGKTVAAVNKLVLMDRIRYAVEFSAVNKVPVYVGEFTAHANPSEDSVTNYLGDLIGIMEGAGFHWSFWEYYSDYRGVGLFNGADRELTNPAAWITLQRFMKQN